MPKKIAIVVWSKTGNTKLMADSVKKGVEEAGFDADIFKAYNFNFEIVNNYDKIALGCPAMGSETLEDTEFLPMYKNIKPYLKDKKYFSSVLMVGEMENGCKIGKKTLLKTE